MKQVIVFLLLSFIFIACGKSNDEIAKALKDADFAYATEDYKAFVEIIKPLAEAGNKEAQFKLAMAYGSGKGVAQDFTKGMDWLSKAAEQGDAIAQFVLGNTYGQGMRGVKQDYAKAFELFTKAESQTCLKPETAQICAAVQTSLGWMYYKGYYVKQDYKKAYSLVINPAKKGDANAQETLGEIYENGHGVPQDYLQAYMWYSLALTKDHVIHLVPDEAKRTKEELDRLSKKMTPKQIKQASKMILGKAKILE